MSRRQDIPVLWKQVPHGPSYIPSMTVLFAVAALALGVGVFLALPEHPETTSPAVAAATNGPETTPAADESLCDKQAWPYIDQRCSQRVEAARGTRQVRVVTDKGNSVTVRTPEPIVEPKPKPAPQSPVVATAERPIGPPAAPVADAPPKVEKVVAAPEQQQVAPAPQKPAPQAVPEPTPTSTIQVTAVPQRSTPAPQNPTPQSSPAPAPATVQAAVAPANPPATSDPGARGTSNTSANMRNAPVAPAAASAEPMTAGVDAFADGNAKKSRSARAAEKAARREAKRQKAIEENNGGVPEEVVATVKAAPAEGQTNRRSRNAAQERARGSVPEEVLQAVEEAAAREAGGRRGRQIVTVDSPRSGGRIYVVPGNEIGGW
jgi:hypothetical protein